MPYSTQMNYTLGLSLGLFLGSCASADGGQSGGIDTPACGPTVTCASHRAACEADAREFGLAPDTCATDEATCLKTHGEGPIVCPPDAEIESGVPDAGGER